MMSFGWEGLVDFGLKGTPGQSAPQQKEKTDYNGIKEKVKQFLAQLLPNNYQTLKQVNSHYLTLQDDTVMMALFKCNKCFFRKLQTAAKSAETDTRTFSDLNQLCIVSVKVISKLRITQCRWWYGQSIYQITWDLLPEHLSSHIYLQATLEKECTLISLSSCFSFHCYTIYGASISSFSLQNVALICACYKVHLDKNKMQLRNGMLLQKGSGLDVN